MAFLDNVWLVISRNAEHVAAIVGIMWLGTKFIPVISGWIDRLSSKKPPAPPA